jgi:hypothetical protein
MRQIGWLNADTVSATARLNAFKRGLADLGWTEGHNSEFQPYNDSERLRSAAQKLAASPPDLIFVQRVHRSDKHGR